MVFCNGAVETMNAKSLQHVKSLDGLRGIAVLLVLLAHMPFIASAESSEITLKLVNAIAGYLGVDIFFVLSGFLITSILVKDIESGGPFIGRFYLKRAFRILPVIIIAVSICALLFPEHSYFYQLFFLSNYYFVLVEDPHPLRQLWSLAVEEQFYLFWPLLLLFSTRVQRVGLVLVVLVLVSVCIIVIYDFVIATEISRDLIYKGFESRMVSLVAGSAMAVYGVPDISPKRLLEMTILGIGVVVLAMLLGGLHGFAYFATVNAFGFLVVASCIFIYSHRCTGIGRSILQSDLLCYIGRISYGLYVYHLPVFFYFGVSFMQDAGASASLIDVCLVYAVTFAIAISSWHCVEKPLLNLKHSILPRWSVA